VIVFSVWIAEFKQACSGVVLWLKEFFYELVDQEEFVQVKYVVTSLLKHLVLVIAYRG